MKEDKRVKALKKGMEMYNEKLKGINTKDENVKQVLLDKTIECSKEIAEKRKENNATIKGEYWDWLRQGVMNGYYYNLGYLSGAEAVQKQIELAQKMQKEEA